MKTTTDPITLIRAANPVADTDRLPDGPEHLVEEIIGSDAVPARIPNPRRRRALVLAAAMVAVVAAAAASFMIVNPQETTGISCNGEVHIPALSGDPIADCSAAMRQAGREPVDLAVFANSDGFVGVFERGSEGPGWAPLEEGFAQDDAVLVLEQTLSDITTGVEAACYTMSEAAAIVDSELEASGLGWPIETRPAENSDAPSCAVAIVDSVEQRVLIVQVPGGGADSSTAPDVVYASHLNEHLDTNCLTLNDAVTVAEDLALESDAKYFVQITPVDEPDAECASANFNAGGSLFVVVRGQAIGPVELRDLPILRPEESTSVAATPHDERIETWGSLIREVLAGIGLTTPENVGVVTGDDGSAYASATEVDGRGLLIGFQLWQSGEQTSDRDDLQTVLGMTTPGEAVSEGVLFSIESDTEVVVKLAVDEGFVFASIPSGGAVGDTDVDADLLTAIVRTISPVARQLMGGPEDLEIVNYLPHQQD